MSNHEVIVAAIGPDQPGVIACVSAVITRLGCNIREMTQSTLHDQFAGIYLVDKPDSVSNEFLNAEIEKAVEHKKIFGEQRINIAAMRAFPIGEGASMQAFEVMIPSDLDTRSLHRLLLERAKGMGLSLTMQHRDIFEAVHRITMI